MNFPALNISPTKWNDDDLIEYLIFDDFIYTKDDKLFDKYYRNQLFCDCDGKIYKAVRKKEMTEKWRDWLRFIPNVWKTKVEYCYTHQDLNLEEFRNYLIERIKDLEQNEFTKEWASKILKSKNHAQMLCDVV